MNDINWKPTDRIFRQFGAASAGVLAVVAFVVSAIPLALVACVTGISLIVFLTVAQPSLLRIPFLALTVMTWPIGKVVSEAVLLLMFFGVVVPTGIVVKLMGLDLLGLSTDDQKESYWEAMPDEVNNNQYFQQF